MLASCEQELPHNIKTQIDTPAALCLSIEGTEETVELMAPKSKSYDVMVKANSLADDLLTFTVKANSEKVKEYNKANGTDYEIVPTEAYTLSGSTLYLPRYNTQSSSVTLTLKADGLPDDGKTRLLPITIEKIEGTPATAMEAQDSTVYVKFTRLTMATIKFKEGTGTENDPFIIREGQHMLAMMNEVKKGQATYLKMEADIDMAEYSEWTPVNGLDPFDKTIHFDGNGHKITNFHSNVTALPSLFGVLKGSVKNLTFETAKIEAGTDNSGAGLIAGSAEGATIENVTIKGLVVETRGKETTGMRVGGLVGKADGCVFRNINVECEISDAAANNYGPNFVGGMIGICEGSASSIDNCHATGSVYGRYFVGGLIGAVATDNAEITNSSAVSTVTMTARYGGGLIGYANRGFKATKCFTKGDLTALNPYCGGFLGAGQGELTIRQCSAEVNITCSKTINGGFIGTPGISPNNTIVNDGTKYGNSLFEDCYATGNITTSDRMTGGFLGVIEGLKNITLRRCYASGDISAVGTLGPIGGLVGGAVQGSGGNFKTEINFTLEKSFAWNKKIDNTSAKNSDGYSSGGIIGTVCPTSTLTDNFRRADMDFTATRTTSAAYPPTEFLLHDQENASPTSPLDCPVNNVCPYHGKAAQASQTLSQAAQALGWSADVWDFSGEMPVLK